MRRRRVAALIALAALIVVVATAALHRMGATPVDYTIAAGKGEYVDVSAVDAATGHVYITTYDSSRDTIQVIDAASAARHTLPTLVTAPAAPAVATDGGRVFLAGSSPNGQQTRVDVFSAFRDTTLRPTAVPLYPSYFPAGMVVRAGVVALASPGTQNCGGPTCTFTGSGVALLDAATARLLCVLSVHGRASAVSLDAHAAHTLVASTTGASFTASRLVISVFDTRTGRLLHRAAFAAPNELIQRMVLDTATGRAFLLATAVGWAPLPFGRTQPQPFRTYLYVIDARSGALVRALHWPGNPGDVAVDEQTGRVFAADTGPTRYVQKSAGGGMGVAGGGMGAFLPVGRGFLHVLDARTGAPLATTPLGVSPRAIAVDARRGRVYVVDAGSHDAYGSANGTSIDIPALASGQGGVSVVDATNGRLLRTVDLGTQPASIVLDERSGQAFIGDGGDGAPRPVLDPWGWLPAPLRQRLPFLPHAAARRPIPGSVIVLDTSRL